MDVKTQKKNIIKKVSKENQSLARSSSDAVKAKRGKQKNASTSWQDQVDSLEDKIQELNEQMMEIEEAIVSCENAG